MNGFLLLAASMMQEIVLVRSGAVMSQPSTLANAGVSESTTTQLTRSRRYQILLGDLALRLVYTHLSANQTRFFKVNQRDSITVQLS